MSKDPLYFEKLGADWSKVSRYDLGQRLKLIFEQLLPDGASPDWNVLEVGCGAGFISERIIGRFPRLTVNDVSARLAGDVSARLGCSALPGDVCELKPDPVFDLVISSECIEHTPDPFRALAGMQGMLKPGGWLVVTTPNKLYYPVLWLAVALKIRFFDGVEHWTWPHETRRWLARTGFSRILFSGCHLVPWQVPFSQLVLPTVDRYGRFLYPLMVNYGFRAQAG
jgi:2-polyprenyl-6-hydroxyphenyl methylase/3-demethylubiquinone-9 3-methyltransferase